MVAPTDYPTLLLELDTAASGGTTRTWNDITVYLRAFTVDYGRAFELDTFQPGVHTYTLDNTSGRFRMFNTSGTYYPNLKSWRRVRLSCTWKSVQYFIAYGYIQSITPTRAGNWSEVQMVCWDALAILAQRQLIPTSVSGSNGDLSVVSRDAKVPGVSKDRRRWVTGPPPGKLAAPPSTLATSIVGVIDANADPGHGNVSVDTTTGVITNSYQAGSAPTGRRATRFAYDINSHAIAGQMVVVTALTDNHINNMTLPLTGALPAQRSDLRVAAVLNNIGWPSGDRLIGTGTNTIQGTTFAKADDVKALQHLQDVMSSELGQLFADPQNRIVFQGQTARTSAPFNTPSCVFSDNPAGGEFDYAELVPVEDNQHIYNNITVDRNSGGSTTVSDSTSITDFNQADFQYSTILSSDAALSTVANALLAKYKTQKLRYDRVVLQPQNSDGLWDYVVSLGISNQVTVKETPPGSSALSTNCFIERITHQADCSAGDPYMWQTAYQLSPV